MISEWGAKKDLYGQQVTTRFRRLRADRTTTQNSGDRSAATLTQPRKATVTSPKMGSGDES